MDANGLKRISDQLSAHYKLGADIDLGGEAFTPIGNTKAAFTGSLDGGGHAVRNLKVSSGGYAGLFGYADGAAFKNLRIEDAEVKSTGDYVGALVGWLSSGTIFDCYVSGVVTGKDNVGGFAGQMTGRGSKLQECCVEGVVTGNSYVGGFTGQLSGSIVDGYVRGSVMSISNHNYTGGIAGYSQSAAIKNCYVSAKVSSNGQGLTYASSSTTILNSFFDRDIYPEWDMENIWEYKEGAYPVLRKIKFFMYQSFALQLYKCTWHSALIRWKGVSGAAEYEIYFNDEMRRVFEPEVLLESLSPDTDYIIKVIAKMDDVNFVTSKPLNLKTGKVSKIKGFHCVDKQENAITLVWEQITDAVSYEVVYNESCIRADTNACTLTGLSAGTFYAIYVRALLKDGGEIVSSPIIEKIYGLIPRTDYAKSLLQSAKGRPGLWMKWKTCSIKKENLFVR